MAAVVLGTRDLPACPAEVAPARHWLTGLLHDHPSIADDVVLLACETITNAIRHTRSATVSVVVLDTGDALRVEVTDDGSGGVPRLAEDDPEALTGRGLHLIDALSDGWGTYTGDAGRTVWFERIL
jgi:anti-sigma regulatory factor (Ser/Thr protein kinase)